MSNHETKVKANHLEIEKSCMKNYEDLTEKELLSLEKKAQTLKDKMRDNALEKTKTRINSHTTETVDAAADRIIESQKPANEQVEALSNHCIRFLSTEKYQRDHLQHN